MALSTRGSASKAMAVVCFAPLFFLLALPAGAESDADDAAPLSFCAGIDSWSSYWFRGATVTDRLTLQPRIAMGWAPAGIEIELWNSFAVRDRDRLACCDETDISLTHTRSYEWRGRTAEISIGCTEYMFTGAEESGSHTEEIALGLALGGFFAPSLTGYYDIGLYDEGYLEAGASPEILLDGEGAASVLLEILLGAGSFGEPFGLRALEARCSLTLGYGSLALTPSIGAGYAPAGPYKEDWAAFGGVSLEFGD